MPFSGARRGGNLSFSGQVAATSRQRRRGYGTAAVRHTRHLFVKPLPAAVAKFRRGARWTSSAKCPFADDLVVRSSFAAKHIAASCCSPSHALCSRLAFTAYHTALHLYWTCLQALFHLGRFNRDISNCCVLLFKCSCLSTEPLSAVIIKLMQCV